jgi:hypothetical protein
MRTCKKNLSNFAKKYLVTLSVFFNTRHTPLSSILLTAQPALRRFKKNTKKTFSYITDNTDKTNSEYLLFAYYT